MQSYHSIKNEVLAEAELAGEVLTDAEVDRRVRAIWQPPGGHQRPVAIDARDLQMDSQSNLEGAPSADIGVDLSLTPQGYMDDLGEMTDYYRDGGASQPPPGSSAYDLEGDILQYRPGMTQEEYDNAKAQQRDRVRMIRGMGGDGGFQAQVHPQQVMDIGTADDNEKWNEWVAEDPARMQRYDPAGFAAWQAAQEKQFQQKQFQFLSDKYGTEAAYRWLENRQQGGGFDSDILATDHERAMRHQAKLDDIMARGGTDAIPLVFVDDNGNEISKEDIDAMSVQEWNDARLASMDFYRNRSRGRRERSGYSGAMGGSAASQMPAVGVGPDGQVETNAERFARKTAERQDELDARKLLLRNQNLRGDPATRFTMMADPFGDGLTENQRRALAYMMPGGALAAEVDAANFRQASELAASGLRGVLGPMVAGSLKEGGAAGAAGTAIGRADVKNGGDGGWRTVEGMAYLKQVGDTFDTKQGFVDFLVAQYNYPMDQAIMAAEYVESQRYMPWR